MLIGISGKMGAGKDLVAKMCQYWLFQQLTKSSEEFRDDYTHNYEGSGWVVKKFAGKLKQIVSLLTGIPVADLELRDIKDSFLGDEWAKWAFIHKHTQKEVVINEEIDIEMFKRRYAHIGGDNLYLKKVTVREFLQNLGTNALRDVVHANTHVNALFTDYKLISKGAIWDIDYPNNVGMGPYIQTCRVCLSRFNGYKRQFFCTNCAEDFYPNWIISDLRFPNEAEAVKQRDGLLIRVNRTHEEYSSNDSHPSEVGLDNYRFDYVIDNNAGIPELLEQVRKMLVHFKLIHE